MSPSTWIVGALLMVTSILLTVNGEASKNDLFLNSEGKNTGTPVKRPSFFVGSRYGRSPFYDTQLHNLNVAPRNDRFFLGSRYGKRSDEYMPEVADPEPSRDSTRLMFMSCAYTGVKDFYRCYKGSDNNSIEPTAYNNDDATF